MDTAALPFVVRHSHEVLGTREIRSTSDTIHGLIRLEADRLVVQWRLHRSTESIGMEIRTDEEVGEVQEVEIPLTGVAGAAVRSRWWQWRPRLVLTATDLRIFEEVASQDALRTKHPGELVLQLRRGDRSAGHAFAADVTLAAAELRAGTPHDVLGRKDTGRLEDGRD
jgi:hypothetical protein